MISCFSFFGIRGTHLCSFFKRNTCGSMHIYNIQSNRQIKAQLNQPWVDNSWEPGVFLNQTKLFQLMGASLISFCWMKILRGGRLLVQLKLWVVSTHFIFWHLEGILFQPFQGLNHSRFSSGFCPFPVYPRKRLIFLDPSSWIWPCNCRLLVEPQVGWVFSVGELKIFFANC